MTMTKGERTELRSIVRQQFKVLRAEVVQRQAELMAGVEDEIVEKYSEADKTWDDVQHRIQEAILTANREVNNALYEAGLQQRRGSERMLVTCHQIEQPVRERNHLRHTASIRLEAQVRGALLQLDRQEADLLRTLSVGALESSEAHAFLSGIPTVSELVPVARLAELEKSMGEDG